MVAPVVAVPFGVGMHRSISTMLAVARRGDAVAVALAVQFRLQKPRRCAVGWKI